MRLQDSPEFSLINLTFPAIGKKMDLFWGHPEFVELTYELQDNSGNKPRQGFPVDVLLAIHSLEVEHDRLFPHLKRKSSSVWHSQPTVL